MGPTQNEEPTGLSTGSRSPRRTLAPQELDRGNGRSGPRLEVSVVVPCKNDVGYLSAALESILSQNYPLLECIVVDGGSTDGTIDLLRRYGSRIRWLSEPDRGAFDAINRGWQLSKGEILAWLNADDLWEPGAVRTVVDFWERRPDVDVVYGVAGVVDELGGIHGDLVPSEWDLEYALLHCHHVIPQPASFVRRRILEQVGWLYPAWCHDHDLWLRIARAGGKFAGLPVRLATARVRPNNRGAQPEIVIPAKLALTRRFFADPGLPPTIRRLERRAISGACMLGVDYVRISRPRDWLLAARFLVQAIAVDPGNTRLIGERLARLFGRCIKSLLSHVVKLHSKIFGCGASISWRLVRLRLALFDFLYLLLPRYSRAAFHGDRVFQQMLDELVTRLGVAAFVETGTFLGISTAYVATKYPDLPIHTFEVNLEYFRRARRRLRRFANVTLSCASSDVSLHKLLEKPSSHGPGLFFLDAHWYDFWPLEREIDLISSSRRPAVIVIDDFQVPGMPEFGFDTYRMQACSLEAVIPKLRVENVYQVLFPQYSAGDARLEKNPENLRGYVIIFQNLSEDFERLRHAGFVAQHYQEFDIGSAAAPVLSRGSRA